MSIDTETVKRVATLARISVSDDRLAGLAGEMSQILDWVEQLSEVDTDGVAPMTSVTDVRVPLRADVANDGGYPERVLANAPDRVDGFYTVPKVVE